MTNETVNSFVAAIETRIAFETQEKATACDASIALLKKAKQVYASTQFVALLAQQDMSSAFINAYENVNSKFCMKAIARTADYLQFAFKAVANIKTDNARTVLETAINLHRDSLTMTRNDAYASCTSKKDKAIEVAKEREKYISRRETIVSAAKRQASMSLKALCALDILRETSTKDVYALNTDSKLTQAILERYAQ
jgi:hypothetical protein